MRTRLVYFILSILICVLLVACGPSQEELDATATQVAADIFATQTALAPTATLTPTSTLTATPTPTETPTPTSTDTPEPTVTPTPGLDTLVLTLDDFPEGFIKSPDEQMKDLEASYPAGSKAFSFSNIQNGQNITGVIFPAPASVIEQRAFDSSFPFVVEAAFAALGSTENVQDLTGVDEIGEVRDGSTTVLDMGDIPLRMDVLVFRRGAVAALLMVVYADGDQTIIPLVDIASLLDARIAEYP